jgi:uncharacterized protein
MLRTSSYTMYVDLPNRPDEMLLVHGYTGAQDHVQRPVAEFLRHRESGRVPKPLYGAWGAADAEPAADAVVETPAEETLETLRRRGYLTTLDPEQEEALFVRTADALHRRGRQTAPSYLFIPSYDCNLRCGYCFQDAMRTDCSLKHLLGTMQPAMVDRIFAAIPAFEAKMGVPTPPVRSFGLFGGEPLLARHRPIVERILERAREMAAAEGGRAELWAVTNGTELPAYADLLGPDAIASVQITLDGPPEIHDTRRIYADGSGSFAATAAGIDCALAAGCAVQLRINLDRTNLEQLPRLAAELIARGWTAHEGFTAYAAPVRPAGPDSKEQRPKMFTTWHLDRALTALRESHPETAVIGRPDEGIRSRARQVFRGEGMTPRLRPAFCGAHDRMVLFDAFGDMYACWERTGDRKLRVGHVTPEAGIELNAMEHERWRGRTVTSNPVCRKCRYALSCGGGCAILALEQRGTFEANYCDGFAHRFRASLAEAFLEHESGVESPDRPVHSSLCA